MAAKSMGAESLSLLLVSFVGLEVFLLNVLLQALANTPLDSPERFKARALLPGMAKRLRDLGPAVGAVIEVLGATDSTQLSSRYGGESTSTSKSEAVYQSIGKTITISGR
jgi:hypothetical protein